MLNRSPCQCPFGDEPGDDFDLGRWWTVLGQGRHVVADQRDDPGDTVAHGNLVTLLIAESCLANNGTKSTPALSADLFGDWREEVILPHADGQKLRIFMSTYPTEIRMNTLMHDPQYRNAIAYILKINGYPAGDTPLPNVPLEIAYINLDAPPGPVAPPRSTPTDAPAADGAR